MGSHSEGANICTDYLVLPPAGPIFDDPEMRKTILKALKARFPQYTWELYSGDVPRRKHFVVLPATSALPPVGEAIAMSIEALEEFDEFLEFQFVEPNRRIN